MAPNKTMAVSQKEQSQQKPTNLRSSQGGEQAAKPRKRKGKQSNSNSSNNNSTQNQANTSATTTTEVSKITKQQVNNRNLNSIEDKVFTESKSFTSAKQQQAVLPPQSPKPINSVSDGQVTTKIKKDYQVSKQQEKEVIVPNQATITSKQLSTEEPDDIDAGIELDGSSNSGSSVKDISEEQSKSASVSPVMAQNNVIETSPGITKHAAEITSLELSTGSLCNNLEPASKKANATTTTAMQKLAAYQQVIDADEQQLQQKLQSKQRKSSLKSNLNTSIANDVTNNNSINSKNVIASPQSPAMCKICEQHVYQMERVMAEKSVYHRGCFRCYQCKVQLRMDNYSSHEGQVYCKAHHRQIFQPQVKVDNENDDIVAKSKIRQRQMIICENEPAILPEDVIRSDTKLDDGIDKLNLNLNNILEKFERGNNGEDSQPSSATITIEKPSFDIKKTLMAFETNAIRPDEYEETEKVQEKRVVKKLTNLNSNGFLKRQTSTENESSLVNDATLVKPLAIRRSESLMMRLKKYESRINGEQVSNEDSDHDEPKLDDCSAGADLVKNVKTVPKKLTSLKNQWENGDISKRRHTDEDINDDTSNGNDVSDSINGNSPVAEKNEELIKIRQQLARKKSGESASIKNIYENAIKEAQQQKRATKLNSSDLSALNRFSTTEIQQQLLQNGNKNSQNSSTPSTPNKDHFQLNLSNKANKLKERFEQGLVNNGSVDDSDASNGDEEPTMTKLEQLRREKLEDLSIFTEGEIKAREARSMFQQIDRRLSAASNGSPSSLAPSSRSRASISASMSSKIQNKMSPSITNSTNADSGIRGSASKNDSSAPNDHQQQPIRLTNNVRT